MAELTLINTETSTVGKTIHVHRLSSQICRKIRTLILKNSWRGSISYILQIIKYKKWWNSDKLLMKYYPDNNQSTKQHNGQIQITEMKKLNLAGKIPRKQILYHNQTGFNQGCSWFNICESINAVNHINAKNKSHCIMSRCRQSMGRFNLHDKNLQQIWYRRYTPRNNKDKIWQTWQTNNPNHTQGEMLKARIR